MRIRPLITYLGWFILSGVWTESVKFRRSHWALIDTRSLKEKKQEKDKDKENKARKEGTKKWTANERTNEQETERTRHEYLWCVAWWFFSWPAKCWRCICTPRGLSTWCPWSEGSTPCCPGGQRWTASRQPLSCPRTSAVLNHCLARLPEHRSRDGSTTPRYHGR